MNSTGSMSVKHIPTGTPVENANNHHNASADFDEKRECCICWETVEPTGIMCPHGHIFHEDCFQKHSKFQLSKLKENLSRDPDLTDELVDQLLKDTAIPCPGPHCTAFTKENYTTVTVESRVQDQPSEDQLSENTSYLHRYTCGLPCVIS